MGARDTAGIVLDSKGTVAALEGRSAEDHKDSSSRMQMTIHGETLFVMNSFNLIQSLDMSMHIPCGRVMSVFTPIFKKKKWKVSVGRSRSVTYEIKPKVDGRMSSWRCTATKTVR